MLYSRRLLGRLATSCAVLGFTVVSSGALAQADFPDAPLTVIVPAAAGGGTDASVRILAKGLEDELGVPVNVVNRSPALPGHLAIVNAEPDGYTIGAVYSVIGKFHWLGEADITHVTGTETVAGAWRGIAGPAGIPEDRARILEEALTNVFESETFQNEMERAGFGLLFRDSEDFAQFLAENDAFHGRFLKAVGAIEG